MSEIKSKLLIIISKSPKYNLVVYAPNYSTLLFNSPENGEIRPKMDLEANNEYDSINIKKEAESNSSSINESSSNQTTKTGEAESISKNLPL